MLRVLERKSGLIVYIGLDGNIYTIDQSGARQNKITDDAVISTETDGDNLIYQFPSWSPGRRLAFVRISGTRGTFDEASIYTSSADGKDLEEIFHSEKSLPFYLYWSPDETKMSFLTTFESGGILELGVVSAEGGEVRTVGKGAPLYWDWSPDNASILLHTGGSAKLNPLASLSLVRINGDVKEEKLDLRPALFQAPAWSSDGDEFLVAAETDEGGEALLLSDFNGTVKQIIASSNGSLAFSWSPDGDRLAYLAGEGLGSGGSGRTLKIVNPGKLDDTITASAEEIAAFFWSPDSKKIAYLVPNIILPTEEVADTGEQGQTLLLELRIVDVRSGESYEVTKFIPTQHFISTLPFFDQYQRSVTIWSPDSKHLVISGSDNDSEPGIYVVEAGSGIDPRYIAAGHLAYWSWK